MNYTNFVLNLPESFDITQTTDSVYIEFPHDAEFDAACFDGLPSRYDYVETENQGSYQRAIYRMNQLPLNEQLMDQILFDAESSEEELLHSVDMMPESWHVFGMAWDEMTESQQQNAASDIKEYIRNNARTEAA